MAPHRVFYTINLCVLLFTTSTSYASTICPAGYFRASSGDCTACPPGTFWEARCRTCDGKCRKCYNNQYTTASAVVSTFLCRRCPIDHVSKRGADSPDKCRKCPEGLAATSSGKCVSCLPGTYITSSGCTPCRQYQYSNVTNARKCTYCGMNHRVTQNQSMCEKVVCPPGHYFSPSDDKCVACYGITISDGKQTECQQCPARKTILDFDAPHVTCDKCPAGQYLTNILPPVDNSIRHRHVCRQCPAGTMTKGDGKIYCRGVDSSGLPQACPAGMFEDEDGDCETCAVGYRYVAKKKRCLKCGEGKVSPGGLTTVCQKCPKRMEVVDGTCRCKAGMYFHKSRCIKCPAGSYRPPGGPNGCLSCPFNHEAPSNGASACTACMDGYTSRPSDGRKCEEMVRCPEGQIGIRDITIWWVNTYISSNRCVNASTGCPPGMSLVQEQIHPICRNITSGKEVCPPRTYEVIIRKSRRCLGNCDRGWFVSRTSGMCARCSDPRRVATKKDPFGCLDCRKGFGGFGPMEKCLCGYGKRVNATGHCVDCDVSGIPMAFGRWAFGCF